MKLNFIKRIFAVSLVCSVILFIVGILSYEASSKFIAANKMVNHTQEVLHEFEKILLNSVDATVAERGFIITGDEKFLQSYIEEKTEMVEHFNYVRNLTKDNSSQQARLDTLKQLSEKLIAFYESCIFLRKSNKTTEAIAMIQSGKGIRLENTIRIIIHEAQRNEELLLAKRMKQSESDTANFRTITMGFLSTTVVFIIAIYLSISARTTRFTKFEDVFIKTLSDYKFAIDESSIVALTDQKGIIIHANDNFCKISKYSREELIGQDYSIVNSDYHPKELICDLGVTANGRLWRGELRNRAKDGTIYWVGITVVPILHENGKPYQYMTIGSNITERKKAEEEILESKTKLDKEAAALTELNEACNRLWQIDDFYGGVQEMLSFSLKIFGARMGNVQIFDEKKKTLIIVASKGLSKEFLDHFHEIPADEVTACGKALRNRHQIIIENVEKDEGLAPHLHILRAAGVKSVQSTPLLNINGTAMGIISIHHENTGLGDPFRMRIMELYARKAESFMRTVKITNELKELNTNLEDKISKRTLELQQSLVREKDLNELKSRFVSMASHEFRIPLTTILSSISLIECYHTREQKEKRDKHISRVKSSIKNLVDILNNFLSIDKLEYGKMEVTKATFDLYDFSKETVEEMNEILKQGQSIHFSYNGKKEVSQDKMILRYILFNLLSNAIKYSEENKEIQFLVEVSSTAIRIKIKDNGIGIPEEEQIHLFGNFYRAKNVKDIQGTGLGLNIVKKFVELLDGSINFTSTLNKGTTFIIQFPQK